MLKKLPHGFTFQDLDELLEKTDLTQFTKRRHIPKYVIDRRHDIYGSPLAVAFAHFESSEHAELGINSLWHQEVWDRDAGCTRRITVSHANSTWEPPTPEVSPEPSHTDKPWEGKNNKHGMSWRAKAKPVPPSDDATQPPAPTEALLAIADETKDSTSQPQSASSLAENTSTATVATKDKKTKVKTIQDSNGAFNSWNEQSWDHSQWDTSSFHDYSNDWWTRPEDICHTAHFSQQHDLPPPFSGPERPRFMCIVCRIPFLKWSQCKHHMITSCVPVGTDVNIIDDDEDIKKICERLCDPFVTPNNPLSA